MWYSFLNCINRFFKSRRHCMNNRERIIFKAQKDKTPILALINPWLDKLEKTNKSSGQKKQNKKEIIDIANFINSFDSSLVIENTLDESPDVILSKNEKRIGVELMDLTVDQEEKEKEGIFKKLFSQIETELQNEKKLFNGLYEIEFIKDNLSLKRKVKNNIKKEIIALIKEKKIEQFYIKQIVKSPMSDISLYTSNDIVATNLKRETVLEKIKKKETLLANYSQKNIDETWLLLVVSGVQKSSNYSFIQQDVIKKPYQSNFDRIFIFNLFEGKTIQLKTTHNNNLEE